MLVKNGFVLILGIIISAMSNTAVWADVVGDEDMILSEEQKKIQASNIPVWYGLKKESLKSSDYKPMTPFDKYLDAMLKNSELSFNNETSLKSENCIPNDARIIPGSNPSCVEFQNLKKEQ